MAEATKRPLLKFREGEEFSGFAFGKPIRVRLSYPEWVELEAAESFWTWECVTSLGGGATLAESVLAESWEPANPSSITRGADDA